MVARFTRLPGRPGPRIAGPANCCACAIGLPLLTYDTRDATVGRDAPSPGRTGTYTPF
ncbi:hypothetical protein Acsp04_31860 [Actinomadura sp. NBRC 104425]|nr:hypothetical protein Acsp04_31860 [Actinomadura sp. NBRC 104425]